MGLQKPVADAGFILFLLNRPLWQMPRQQQWRFWLVSSGNRIGCTTDKNFQWWEKSWVWLPKYKLGNIVNISHSNIEQWVRIQTPKSDNAGLSPGSYTSYLLIFPYLKNGFTCNTMSILVRSKLATEVLRLVPNIG